MKPPPFEYSAAHSVEEAVDLLAEHGDEAKVLAGGQSLLPLLSLRLARPGILVDINPVAELATISDGSGLELGAMVRHRAAERSAAVRTEAPLVIEALGLVGHAAIRSRGTIGGSVAHADPAAELPAVLLALDGEVVATSRRGARTVAARDLFAGFLTTTLEPDELLTAVRLPAGPARVGSSFQEFSRRSGDFGVVGVACGLALSGDGRVDHGRLAFSGVAGTPVRADGAEAVLAGASPSAELWEQAGREAASQLDPPGDLHGSPAYRRHLAAVLAQRALAQAFDRAKGAK
ncbi:MAG TPA: xanthine dehydrogenase family protein subunit M [Acidimicrobiales bacterium]|nr:xanthine dehydrogenase family protein subunit M [Acidimicrobiales bacterium]